MLGKACNDPSSVLSRLRCQGVLRLTPPMVMLSEHIGTSLDPWRDEGCSTCTSGSSDAPGTSSLTTCCGPAGAGEGTNRFVPLRDSLAFAFRWGGVSTNTSGSFPFAAQCAQTG